MAWLCGKPLNFEISLSFRKKILNLRIFHGLEAIYTQIVTSVCLFFPKSALDCYHGKGWGLL